MKSFWLCLSPWTPPRRFRSRRPVSGKAPGRDAVPAQNRHARRHEGHSPRRHPPLPSVSSSSSSFCLLRFPAVVPFASPVRGSVPGPASPGRLSGVPSIGFKSVKIMFGLSLRSGAACAAPSVPSGFRSFRRPAPFRPVRAQVQFARQVPRRPGSPVYHPVPASCSARLLFVLLMVRISVRFVFGSVFRPVRFACSVPV